MSLPKPFRIAAALLLALGLAACFRPLYGPTASGERLDSVLAAIEVAKVDAASPSSERFSHYLRSELVYDLNGSGQAAAKRYKLALAFDQRFESPVVDTATGRAQAAILTGNVTYTLTTLDGSKVLTAGKATASASYDRSPQRFATVRAARDADIRLAKVLSEQIRTRLSAALASGAV
jgi:LPS-assembly lipoprotein